MILKKEDFKICRYRITIERDKTVFGVRVIHEKSHSVGECHDLKDDESNLRHAFLRLKDSKNFRIWLNKRLIKVADELNIDDVVEIVEKNKIKKRYIPKTGLTVYTNIE